MAIIRSTCPIVVLTLALVMVSRPASAQEEEPSEPRIEESSPPASPPPRSSGGERHGGRANQDAPVVVRAEEGDWGMFFRFGGLSTLLAGNNTRTVRALTVTQVGIEKVLGDDWQLPFFFGAGLRNNSPNVGASQ